MKRKWWKECVVYQIYPRSFFWLRRGVDGFRLDALDMLLEIPICPTTPPNPHYKEGMALDAVVIHEHTRSQERHSRTNCRHQARVRRIRRARRHTPAARVALAAESFVPVSTEPALTHGIQTSVVRRAPLLVHRRELPGRRLLVILNMAGDELLYDFSELSLEAELLLSTFLDRENERVAACVSLRGNEGIVLALS